MIHAAVDMRWLSIAKRTTSLFAVIFTVGAGVLAVLAISLPFARPERIGFGLLLGAAALAHWVIYWLIWQASEHDGSTARR